MVQILSEGKIFMDFGIGRVQVCKVRFLGFFILFGARQSYSYELWIEI